MGVGGGVSDFERRTTQNYHFFDDAPQPIAGRQRWWLGVRRVRVGHAARRRGRLRRKGRQQQVLAPGLLRVLQVKKKRQGRTEHFWGDGASFNVRLN